MKCISVMKKHVIKGTYVTSTCKVTTVKGISDGSPQMAEMFTLSFRTLNLT